MKRLAFLVSYNSLRSFYFYDVFLCMYISMYDRIFIVVFQGAVDLSSYVKPEIKTESGEEDLNRTFARNIQALQLQYKYRCHSIFSLVMSNANEKPASNVQAFLLVDRKILACNWTTKMKAQLSLDAGQIRF